VGGIIPLSAYLLLSEPASALRASSVVTLLALAVFGGVKGRFTGVPVALAALQTCAIGGVAAAAAYMIAQWIA
jgi:VIT1/CCC1 family predicted Fe2+/Mn2+ transporter